MRPARHHYCGYFYSAPDTEADQYCDEYCYQRVCLCVCVCLSTILSSELHVRSLPIFVHATYGRGSILLGRRTDKLCTSGFTDDVIFAHKPRLLDVAAKLKRSAHAALGLATINRAQ